MKKSITLLGLMVSLTIIVYSQRVDFRSNGRATKSVSENLLTSGNYPDSNKNYDLIMEKIRKITANRSSDFVLETKFRLDAEINQGWDINTSQWLNYDKDEYTYDANGNMIQNSDYDWDETTSQWVSSGKEDFTYDAIGNMTTYIYYVWDINNQWLPEWKEEYSYNAAGSITQGLAYTWDESTGEWINDSKFEITYDINANITQTIIYFWDEMVSQWIAADKIEITYDDNDNLIQEMFYFQDNNQWEVYMKNDYTYNFNNYLTLLIQSDWDADANQWISSWKREYTNDTNGSVILELFYYWDEFNSQWDPNNKDEYAYDINGNPVLEIYYAYQESAGQFIETAKYSYSYDLMYDLDDLIIPPIEYFLPDYADKIVNKPVDFQRFNWNTSTNVWEISNQNDYYYSEQVVNITEINDAQYRVYPNPAKDVINIANLPLNVQSTFELYDAGGRKVMQKQVSGDAQFHLNSLQPGLYFYNIISNAFKQSGKIMKE